MTKNRIVFLVLTVFLVFPVFVPAQNSSADKNWDPFWKSFSKAVNRKNKATLKPLMASARDFSSGGGTETPTEWLNLVERQKWWDLLQKSVRLGTKSHSYDGRPSRITKDDHLVFVYINKQWRFVGPMGD